MASKKVLLSALLAATMFAAVPSVSFVPVNAAESNVVQTTDKGSVDWTTGVIKVTGGGAPPDKGSPAQKRLMAKRAAQVDGYRQLAEAIEGVHVDSETSVKDFVTESDVIKTKVTALVKGAVVVATRNMSDGSVEVDLVAKLYGKDGLFSVIEPTKPHGSPPPEPQVKPAPPSANYTGLVIDARGLGVQPAMSPALLDEQGGEIYVGRLSVDADFVVEQGIVSYVTSVDQAKKLDRIGSNPLIVRGKKISGGFKADVVVDNKDAATILGAEEKSKILDQAKVAILM